MAGNLFTRLLGPAADVVGEQWADRVRERNLRRLLEKTAARDADEVHGTVPPRLASQTFEAAQYAEDELLTEYFSGVLSSAKSSAGTNDSGVAWTALIARLSSDQIRLHFLLYSSVRPVFQSGEWKRLGEVHTKEVLVDFRAAAASFGWAAEDNSDERWDLRWSDAIDGLMREGLIGSEGYAYGPIDSVRHSYPANKKLNVDFDLGLRFAVTVHGVRLFVWGMGAAKHGADAYLQPAVPMRVVDLASAVPSVSSALYEGVLVDAPKPHDESTPVDQ